MKKILVVICYLLLANILTAQITINSILVNGNAKTKKEIIIRELAFKINETYTEEELNSKITSSLNNLTNLKLFNFVDIDKIEDNNYIEISINVIEKWYVWPYPILEISDRNFNSWWEEFSQNNYSDLSRLNYGVFLNLENFRGRNEVLNIKFRKGFKEHYLIEYSNPYFNKNKTLGLNLRLNLFRRQKTFFNTLNNELIYHQNTNDFTSKDYSIEFGFKFRKDIHKRHNLEFGYFKTVVSDSIIIQNPNYLKNNKTEGSYFRTTYIFKNELRDYVIYPTKGSLLRIELVKFNGLSSPVNHFEVIGNIEKHYSINKNLFLGSSFNFRISQEYEQPYFSQIGFGFEEYVRGYEYYVIDGQSYWISRTACKYALVKKKYFNVPFVKMSQFKKSHHSIYIGIFSDLGYINDSFNSETNPLQSKLLWGKGIALDYLTYYDQILRIEYSMNHLGEKGVFLHFSNPFGSKK